MTKIRKPKRSSVFGSRLTSVVSVALTLVIIEQLTKTSIVARRVTDDVRNKLTVTVRLAAVGVLTFRYDGHAFGIVRAE